MKNLSTKHFFVLTIVFLLMTAIPAFADDPPPPPPQEHGQNGNQPPGGGAPVGEGVAFLVTFGLAYGYRKFIKRKEED
nr:hypothetical protein [Bacteroidota bacterium]